MERTKRAGAGRRMTALVGEEEEKDKEFWGEGNALWEEEDSEFSEVESEPDVFDSDFNDTETEESEGENSEEERKIKARERRAKAQSRKAKKGYQEPASSGIGDSKGDKGYDASKKANEINQQLSSTTKYLHDKNRAKMARLGLLVDTAKDKDAKGHRNQDNRKSSRLGSVERAKSESGSVTLAKSTKSHGSKKSMKSTPKGPQSQSQIIYSQEELLTEAALTELENEKWLLARKRQLEESTQLESNKSGSKKGMYPCYMLYMYVYVSISISI